MFRARLAALIVSGGLALVSGCAAQLGCCGGGSPGLFSRFNSSQPDCCCNSTMVGHYGSSTMVSPDSIYASPPTTVYPGTSAPPPRVIAVPQAPALQYNPMP